MKPYRGKPAVRNFRGDDGDVGIIRSPVRAIVLLDRIRTDRIDKLREYQAASSIQRYVILEQKSAGAAVFARQGGVWTGFAVTAEETLRMPEIGAELPLAELYTGLDLSPWAEDAGRESG